MIYCNNPKLLRNTGRFPKVEMYLSSPLNQPIDQNIKISSADWERFITSCIWEVFTWLFIGFKIIFLILIVGVVLIFCYNVFNAFFPKNQQTIKKSKDFNATIHTIRDFNTDSDSSVEFNFVVKIATFFDLILLSIYFVIPSVIFIYFINFFWKGGPIHLIENEIFYNKMKMLSILEERIDPENPESIELINSKIKVLKEKFSHDPSLIMEYFKIPNLYLTTSEEVNLSDPNN